MYACIDKTGDEFSKSPRLTPTASQFAILLAPCHSQQQLTGQTVCPVIRDQVPFLDTRP
jgi:hypothetical protein